MYQTNKHRSDNKWHRFPACGQRLGFTLVELLVVIAIISILIGMLFPALQGMRESARQTQCQYRLQNLYLAVAEYHVSTGQFPPGSLNPTGPIESNEQGLHHNWIEHCLPYMDLAVYAKKIDWQLSVYQGVNNTLRQESFSQLRCPSATAQVLFASNFAGSHHPIEASIAEDNLGVLFLNKALVPEVDIADGLQATLLAGEKLALPGDLGWNSGTRATLRNVGHPFQTGYDQGKPVPVTTELFVGGFGSAHPSGVLLVTCAGQARPYDRSTDEQVLRQLADRRDIAETASP